MNATTNTTNTGNIPTIKLYAPEYPPKRKPSLSITKALMRYVIPALKANNRSPATIADVERSVREWCEFWNASKPDNVTSEEWIPDPLLIRRIKRRHLEAWQAALLASTKPDGTPRLSRSSVNRKLGSIRQVLNTAEKHGKLRNRPRLEKLATKAAPKHYMKHEQAAALWAHCDALTWPRSPGMKTGDWWRCAIVLYWVYGFRTQELIGFQSDKHALTWSAISFEAETPNPDGTAENAQGWLSYVPQKQKWAKPEPLYLPLTRHTRAAVDRLRRAAFVASGVSDLVDPARCLFPWPGNHRAIYREWNQLQTLAGIKTKRGEPYLLKHFRKTAATYLELHSKGLGAAVCGWAERDASAVMSKHYAVDELTLVQKLESYPVPSCFDELLRG